MAADPLAGLLGPVVSTRPARRAPLAQKPQTKTVEIRTGERFIVGIEGERSMAPVVVIRQVPTDSCAWTMSRREAWESAQRRAQQIKGTASAMRRFAASIEFMALDGTRKVVQEAPR